MYHNDVVADNYVCYWGVWWGLSCWIVVSEGSGTMNNGEGCTVKEELIVLVILVVLFIIIGGIGMHFIIKYW